VLVVVTGGEGQGVRPSGVEADGPTRPVTEYPETERAEPVALRGRDLSGVGVDTTAWQGGPVVLNVWGSWCAPCRTEAPALRAVSAEYAGRGVRFLGVNVKDNAAAARAFERRFQVPYPSLDDSQGRASLALSSYVPASVVPATLVLDRRGRVAARVLGATEASVLRTLLDAVTAEP
jgi:thiol-disulfide isomerase/thioredoxin